METARVQKCKRCGERVAEREMQGPMYWEAQDADGSEMKSRVCPPCASEVVGAYSYTMVA